MVKFLSRTQDHGTVQKIVHEMGIRSLIVPVSREIAILAGGYRGEGFSGGIADTIILATARTGNHRIKKHHEILKEDPEHLPTEFIQLIGIDCDRRNRVLYVRTYQGLSEN